MNWILEYRKLLLVIMTALTLMFAAFLPKSYINFSFESFYPKEDPAQIYFENHKTTFQDKQSLLITIALKSPKKEVFDKTFLYNADSIFSQLATLKNVDSLASATQFTYLKRTALGIKQLPYFTFETEEEVQESKERIANDTTPVGLFITKDRQHLCAHLIIEAEIFDTKGRDTLSNKIDSLLAVYPYEHLITGVPYIRTQYVNKIAQEVLTFIAIAVVLLVIMLSLMFRNVWCVVIPLITVAIGSIWTFGLMAMNGQAINLITNLLIPIVFVVGVSDIIHISTKYFTELKNGLEPEAAMRITLNEIGFATFLTCITTAVGFGALALSDFDFLKPVLKFFHLRYIFGADVPPLKVFGLYGGFGVVATYVISITLIPNLLMVIPKEKLMSARSIEGSAKWEPFLLRMYHLSINNPWKITFCTVLLITVAGFLTTKIPMNMHLLEDLGWRDPVRKAMVFFEENLFGVRPFEMGIEAKGDRKVTDKAVLVEMEKIQGFLEKNTSFNLYLSPVTFLKSANFINHFNRKEHYTLPDSQSQINEMLEFAQTSEAAKLLKTVMTEDGKRARISARTADLGSDEHKAILVKLDAFIQKNCNTEIFNYRYTGHGHLTENNLTYLRENLLNGLIIDFLVIGLVMGLVFRSFRMVIISMLPNMIPLLATAGIMGIFGITLTTSSAVVFVVVFGIAVDDTIHFMAHYKLEREKGTPKEAAIRHTLLGTGKAMILTSIILLSGFFTLLSSTFGGTFNIGLFSLITIVFAVISDLFLAPLLLKYFGE
ncbi:MAG: efflux RND transporter permease subunit [Bacteroidia bacterium]